MLDAIKSGAQKVGVNDNYQPKIIIADNDPAISNGFNESYSQSEKRINCWAHCICAINNAMKDCKVIKKDRALIRSDIVNMQLCQSPTLFDKASELFIKKWAS